MNLPKTQDELARLKAQWQAEALERLYAESQGSGVINRGSLIDEARETIEALTRQLAEVREDRAALAAQVEEGEG